MGSPSEGVGKQSSGRLKSPALFPFLSSCGFRNCVEFCDIDVIKIKAVLAACDIAVPWSQAGAVACFAAIGHSQVCGQSGWGFR